MEHCNDPQYFENRFEVRKKEIKNEAKIKTYSTQLLKTLVHIHNHNIVHCDLKFPNILLHRPTEEEKLAGKKPYIKLCDFGIAQILERNAEGKMRAVMKERSGTQQYMAPELSPVSG